jgi:ABC-type uncharacterized transport system ATPase subunit
LAFIPDLAELEMDGKTIVLSLRVIKMLDEMCPSLVAHAKGKNAWEI